MEFFAALKDTPIPTILVIAGIIFLLLGIATIKKPIVIDVTPSGRKISLVLGIALLGVGLYIFTRQVLEQGQLKNTPTETPILGATETQVSIIDVDTETPSSNNIVFSSADAVHLGDQSIQGWPELAGECLVLRVPITMPVQEVILSLETFGVNEREIIKVNDSEISLIPPLGDSNQDNWSESRSFNLAIHYFVNGINIMEICAAPVAKDPSYSGEVDDFQVRNIQVTTKQ